jgi:release factor glutamine methyltransferase
MLSIIYKKAFEGLNIIYDRAEAKELAEWLIEYFYNKKNYDYAFEAQPIRPGFDAALDRLLASEPIQYVLGESFFYGRRFVVDKSVLIPRPETELLVAWVIEDHKYAANPIIMDIGTGSGCIAISLKAQLTRAQVCAVDISKVALNTAKLNAHNLSVEVSFKKLDILNYDDWLGPKPDIIVSNPPYIRQLEAAQMHTNVLDFEPNLALFVPDTDPLLFYRAIGQFAIKYLNRPGSVYFEINQVYGQELLILLRDLGFRDISLRKDQYNNERMVRAFLD